jgi:hypothetical protein
LIAVGIRQLAADRFENEKTFDIGLHVWKTLFGQSDRRLEFSLRFPEDREASMGGRGVEQMEILLQRDLLDSLCQCKP